MRLVIKEQASGGCFTLHEREVGPASCYHVEFTSAVMLGEIDLRGYQTVEIIVDADLVKVWVRKDTHGNQTEG